MKNTYFVESGRNKRSQDLKRIRLQSRRGFNKYTEKFLGGLGLGKVEIAIDIGSGAGECLPYLAKYAKKIIALDGDPERLKLAGEVIKQNRLGKKIAKMVSGVEAINLSDNSVELVYSRLFWQHLTETARKKGGEEIARILKHGGWFIVEDLDIPTWDNEPKSKAHKMLGDSLLELYKKKGTEPRMGLKLKNFVESLGLKIFAQNAYQIRSSGKNIFKQAHVEIFKTTRAEILSKTSVSAKEFDKNLRIYESETAKERFTTIAPMMYQIAARKT